MTTTGVYRALWRHGFFIMALTTVLVAAAWYFTSRQTPIYEASALIRIQQRIADPGEAYGSLIVGERLAQTYAKIVETRELYERVYAAVADEIPPSARDLRLSADPVESLELLWIHARSANPEHAALAANAAPVALRQFIRETGTLRDQIVTVDRAEEPTKPASPNLKLNIAIAVLLGLIFNGALALLIDLLSDRLPDPEGLEASLGLPVLGTVPVLNFSRAGLKRQVTEVPPSFEPFRHVHDRLPQEVTKPGGSRIG